MFAAYANELFAPFFHRMFPNDEFRPHPKYLSQAESIMTSFLVVSGEYLPKFKSVMERPPPDSRAQRAALNMTGLLDYFLPAVCV